MKKLVFSLAAIVLASGDKARADSSDPVEITSFKISADQATLEWTGGRPSYQVQTCSDLNGTWSNVGTPTTNMNATVPAPGERAFFRVVADYNALYQVVFSATWSQITHPAGWTTNAHWSGLVGGAHGAAVHFFRQGETASEGIRLMAEQGQKTQLLAEVGAAITNETADFQLSGGGIRPSPGSVTLTFPQPMRRDFPLVTLCSMVAPSPDWFVGVDSFNMLTNGQWITNITVTLYSNDAGTDSGLTYEAPDQPTIPRNVVTQHTGFPALQNGVIVPFGTFTFTRLD